MRKEYIYYTRSVNAVDTPMVETKCIVVVKGVDKIVNTSNPYNSSTDTIITEAQYDQLTEDAKTFIGNLRAQGRANNAARRNDVQARKNSAKGKLLALPGLGLTEDEADAILFG